MRRRGVGALALAALLATACPGPTPDVTPGDGPSPPRPGGAGPITIAYPYEPPTLDPFTPDGRWLPTRDLVRLVMPSLFRTSSDGSTEPWLLARAPEVDADPPRVVTVEIRDDATWSDGRPISSRDIRRTWRIARRAGMPLYRRITAIERRGPRSARIRFSSPEPRWRELFSAGLGLLPAHRVRTARQRARLAEGWPVSGGPYVLDRWRAGLDMRFVPNERWWGERPPSFERIRIVFVPDATGALELLRQGRVDTLAGYHAPDWRRRVGEVVQPPAWTAGTTWARLHLTTSRGPLASRAVRRALFAALDLRRIVRGLVQSEGTVLDAVRGHERNLRRARRLLERAGWRGDGIRSRDGVDLELTLAVATPDDLGFVVARAIKFQAEDAGIRLEIVPLDPHRMFGEWLNGRDLDAAFVIDRAPSPTEVPPSLDAIPLYRLILGFAGSPVVGALMPQAGPDGLFVDIGRLAGSEDLFADDVPSPLLS